MKKFFNVIVVVAIIIAVLTIIGCDSGSGTSNLNNTTNNNTNNNTNNTTCAGDLIGTEGCQCSATGLCYGDLVCNTDTSICEKPSVPVCGNGIIETNEVCDGTVLPTNWTCLDEGFDGGVLGCNTDCQGFDTSLCTYDIPECIEPELVCGNDCYEPIEHEVDNQGNEEEYKYMKFECCEDTVAMVAHYKWEKGTQDSDTNNCGGCGVQCSAGDVCSCPPLDLSTGTPIESPCHCVTP